MIYTIKTPTDTFITKNEDDMRTFIDKALDEIESGEIYYINVKAESGAYKNEEPGFWSD